MSVDESLATLPPTAPGGGEFGAPVTNRTDTIDESHIGGPARLKLKIQPSPPQYPYADTFFGLEVRARLQHDEGVVVRAPPASLLPGCDARACSWHAVLG